MTRFIPSILASLLALTALQSVAADGEQSFESCSLITSEYLTVLQLTSRGFDRETLKSALPQISPEAQRRVDALINLAEGDGLVETYSRVNAEYGRCAKGVYDEHGRPAPGTREAQFYFCAGENKVRYEILMAALLGAEQSQVARQLAQRHQQAAEALYEMYQSDGELSVFDSLASELKACINMGG